MISADEARAHELGLFRSIPYCILGCVLFYAPVVAALWWVTR